MSDTFGRNVRQYRLKRGMTQRELAERVGVWQTYISQIEHGITPSMEVALGIARVLGITMNDLLAETDEDHPVPA